jgi:hypothetical protein
MAAAREKAYRTEHITGNTEPQDDFRPSGTQLRDFCETGCQQIDLLYAVTLEIQHLASRELFNTRGGGDAPIVLR